MLFFVRTIKGLGNSTVYARIKNNSGLYWDFSALTWVATDVGASTRVYLSELADGDPVESLYSQEAVIPAGGPWIEEAVDLTDGSVIAYDNAVMGELSAIPTTKSTWQEKIEFIFQYLANKRTSTESIEILYKDDNTTTLGTAALSDDGITFQKNKVG